MVVQKKIVPHRVGACLEFSQIEYQTARQLQYELVDARKSGRIDRDIFLVLEHPKVFTLGRRGGIENLTVPTAWLKNSRIPIVHVERGGNITFHGPGQIVVYPIVDLREAGMSIVEFVGGLEEIMIRTALDWGIAAQRNPMNRGVWVGSNKLGSVGIAVRKGISFHGLALNVNLSLAPFEWIHPCGLRGVGVTSMEKASGRIIEMPAVRRAVKKHLEAVFNIALCACSPADLSVAPNIIHQN
jgi:lipoate-protein ligase B